MVRDGKWRGFTEGFRIQAKQKTQIDPCRSGRFDFWRQVIEGMEVIEDDIQLAFRNFFPFILIRD